MTKFECESSEHATFCFKTLGHEIKSAFPDYNKRQVIIVGACQEGRQLSGADTLQPPIFYKCQTLGYYQHIGLHYFYSDSRKQSRKLLEYHTGIIVDDLPDDELQLWRERVQSAQQPAWPARGYIQEIDGNIVVNMGFAERGVQTAFLNRMIDFAKRLLGRE